MYEVGAFRHIIYPQYELSYEQIKKIERIASHAFLSLTFYFFYKMTNFLHKELRALISVIICIAFSNSKLHSSHTLKRLWPLAQW